MRASQDEPLPAAHAVTKLPTQNLDRARRFHRDQVGLEPVEQREGGLCYVCGTTEVHIFASSGAGSGRSIQLAFEVDDIDQGMADGSVNVLSGGQGDG